MGYKVEKKISLAAPRLKVWETYRDELVSIGVTMPAVESIETLDRTEKGNQVCLENKWSISGNIPKAIRNIIPKNLLTYKDVAIWDQSTMICSFEEEPFDGSGIYYCKGQNIFEENENGTILTIQLELTIYPDKIPGIPSFLIKPVLSNIEKFVTKEVAKNLEATAKVVVEYANKNK
jgi:hypothetical protein